MILSEGGGGANWDTEIVTWYHVKSMGEYTAIAPFFFFFSMLAMYDINKLYIKIKLMNCT